MAANTISALFHVVNQSTFISHIRIGYCYPCCMTMPVKNIDTVAWIGCGVMGLPMAGHLLDADYDLRVFTRTRAKAELLLDRGATWADSPAEAADGADIAISIVGYPDDVRETHLGKAGTLAAEQLPRIIIDMTTSQPSLAEVIAEAARIKDVIAIDAPVSGGDIGARNATLSIMVGGLEEEERQVFGQVDRIFKTLGSTVVYQGGPGAGQHTKMVNQILVAASMLGAVEGLRYAAQAGLDPKTVIQSVGAGAAGSWTINNLGPRMIDRDFAPGFYVEHFIKDLGIALDEAKRMQLDLPGLELAHRLYEQIASSGHSRSGTQALLLLYENIR